MTRWGTVWRKKKKAREAEGRREIKEGEEPEKRENKGELEACS